jgi:hypothetical protein
MPIATPVMAVVAAAACGSVRLSTFVGGAMTGDDGVAIFYALDGSTPLVASKQYTAGETLSVPAGGRLRAIGVTVGMGLSRESCWA